MKQLITSLVLLWSVPAVARPVSAAHPWLPCGTRVRVVHQGRKLTVPITDRCDCNSIDLSAGAAHYLGVPLDGIATVQITY
jgi:rare lipoprotein A (peptidoglycan hydrolase)